jgi:tetratricopeptide (TPR) repeat protein
MCLCELGAFDEAIALGEEAVRLAERFDRTLDRVYAYRALAYAYVRKGNRDPAVPLLERGLELCRTGPFPPLLHGIGGPLAYLRALDGRVADAAQLLEESARSTAGWGALMQSIWLGDAYLLLARLEDADGAARSALDVARRQRGRGSEAWAFRLLGDIASHRDRNDVEAAQDHYRQALAIGQPLGMRPLVAHCHLALGKLAQRIGKRQEAHEHLTTAATMFREMDMRFWLEQAEAETEMGGMA